MCLLVSLLVVLIVLAIIFAIVKAIMPLLGLGAPFDNIIYLVMLLIALFVVLDFLMGGGFGFFHARGVC